MVQLVGCLILKLDVGHMTDFVFRRALYNRCTTLRCQIIKWCINILIISYGIPEKTVLATPYNAESFRTIFIHLELQFANTCSSSR